MPINEKAMVTYGYETESEVKDVSTFAADKK